MELTERERALLPSSEDVARYAARGWWVSPPCLDATALELLALGIERYYAGERDRRLPTPAAADWGPTDGDVLRQNDYASLQIDELAEFVRQPLIAAMAARLSGARTIRLFHDQIVYKPSGRPLADTGVGWHTDRAYWRTCTSLRMLTAWIPTADVDEEHGALKVIDRSHLWAESEASRHFHVRDLDTTRTRIRPGGEWAEITHRLAAGQVAFHHCRLVHGSGENRGNRPRVAWAVHLQDETNHWQDGGGTPHMNDLLCRRDPNGHPDYADPDVCPVLWEERSDG